MVKKAGFVGVCWDVLFSLIPARLPTQFRLFPLLFPPNALECVYSS